MASHNRYFLVYGGHAFSGKEVLSRLQVYSNFDKVNDPKTAIAAANFINTNNGKEVAKLFIFKERRGLKLKKSRYRKLVHHYGTSVQRKRNAQRTHTGHGPTPVTGGTAGFSAQMPTSVFAPHVTYAQLLDQQQQINQFFGGIQHAASNDE